MDLNKYIALYLVKNKYCSLPGLGTLQLQKIAAGRKGDSLEPPQYNIEFKNVGSIDDKLPHYIALNENISSNNASNALSVFARQIKEDIAEGRPYILDGLGKFYSNNGQLDFKQDTDLDLGEFLQQLPVTQTPAEAIKTNISAPQAGANDSLRANQQNNPKQPVNIGKILLPIGLIGLLGVGGYFAYNYLKSNKTTNETETIIADTTARATTIVDTTITAEARIANVDTTANVIANKPATVDTNAVLAPVQGSGPAMKVVIQTYKTEAEANKRVASLVKLSKAASMLKGDSANYHVVISLPSTNNTPEKVIDSLRRFYNPGGKVFEVK